MTGHLKCDAGRRSPQPPHLELRRQKEARFSLCSRRGARRLVGSLLLLLLLRVAAVQAQTSSAPSGSTPELLELLLKSASPELCALEHLRVAYLVPELEPVGIERAALCYQQAGQYRDAARLLQPLLQRHSSTVLEGYALFRLCLNSVLEVGGIRAGACEAGLREAADPVHPEWLGTRSDPPDEEVPASRRTPAGLEFARYVAVMALVLERPDRAAPLLELHLDAQSPILRSWAAADRLSAQSHARLPYKRPMTAGLLSALVPGLGRIYTGRPADGIMSFVLVAAPAAMAAYFYQRDGGPSIAMSLAGAAALGMYAGNVYGSVVGARIFNRQQERQWRETLLESYHQRLDPLPQPVRLP